MLKPARFQYLYKKILREVLRVLHGITAPADERENWPPIGSAKLVKRGACLSLSALRVGSGKDQCPARRGELASFASTLLAGIRGHKQTL